ncbi:YihY/virulence factor BrkB family protein [Marmoricola sp. Leaf446]|uniref:YihY/virulence factor BrkB family protein n=1 Tax=Marmoricola sp. Leaf446 TaxID=1736379 RepID=UPI0009E80536|nr:YihY/virulence factor BrkB family protein [Marmoricola sp. Leaf446]
MVRAADDAQRRFPGLGFPLAVVYKYFDDQGPYLAAIITYYTFVAVFPLLLLGTSILGFVLQGDPELQQAALDSTLRQFPIVGDQLGRPEGLQGSVAAVVTGGLIALYGSLGLGTAIQNAMNVAWSVPRNSRPNPFLLRLKSLFLLLIAGGAVLAVTGISVTGQKLLSDAGVGGGRTLVSVATVLLVGGILTVLFRLATAREHPWYYAAPGGFFVAVLWQGLQLLSTAYVNRVLTETSSMNQTFGLVLGLIGLIFLAAVIAVLGMELNVVLVRHLWPRALLTPFTDSVELTEADRKAYTSYARAQRHKGFEQVKVSFGEPPSVLGSGSDHHDDPTPDPERSDPDPGRS